MKSIITYRIKRNLLYTLLGFFIFSFLHSEVGLFDYDGVNHDAHDYCEIVKNISTHVKTSNDVSHKLTANKSLHTLCPEELITIKVQVVLSRVCDKNINESDSEIYKQLNTFLI